jgi:hypothetical protein
MTKQKFLITSSDKDKAMSEVEALISDGWTITSVTPRSVATSGTGQTKHGGFAIVFEKFFPNQE